MADMAILTLRIASAGARASARQTNADLKRLDKTAVSVGSTFRRLGLGLTAAVTAPILLAGRAAVRAAAEFEQAKIAFGVFVGDMGKGVKIFNDLVQFAAKTPLNLSGIQRSAQILLATGTEADKLMGILKNLGDVSRGDSAILQRLALNLGQVKAQGKLTGRELRDFAVAGVPLVQVLAAQYGKTTAQIKKMVSAGRIGFKDVVQAFQAMSGEGGKFENLLSKMSQTLTGKWTTAVDNVRIALASFIDPIKPQLKIILDFVIKFAQAVDKMPNGFKVVIASVAAILAILGPIIGSIGLILGLVGSVAIVWPAIMAGVALVLVPLLKIVAVITLLVIGAKLLANAFGTTWADIGSGLMRFARFATGFLRNFRSNWGILTRWIENNWKIVLGNAVKILFTATKNMIDNFKVLMNKIAAALGFTFGAFFSGSIKSALDDALMSFGKWAVSVIDGVINLGRTIKDVLTRAFARLAIDALFEKQVKLDISGAFLGGLFKAKPGVEFIPGLRDAVAKAGTFKGLLEGLNLDKLGLPPVFKLGLQRLFDQLNPPPGDIKKDAAALGEDRTSFDKVASAMQAGTAEAFKLLTSREGGREEKRDKRQDQIKKATQASAAGMGILIRKGIKMQGVQRVDILI